MTRKRILCASLATLLCGGAAITSLCATSAFAQSDPAGNTTTPADTTAPAMDHHGHHGHRGQFGPGGGEFANATPGERAVFKDIHQLEWMYRRNNQTDQLPTLYNGILAKTQNATITGYVQKRLAHAEKAPADMTQSISTANQKLDTDLAALK